MQILKVIGLLMEYPDELLWECKDDALALVASDAPMLSEFTRELLSAPLLDKQAEWCEVFDRGAPPRCCCLNMFMRNHAIAVRRWLTCWLSTKGRVTARLP